LNYKINGFPVNMPFTDIEAIVRDIHNTNVQQNDDPKSEFAVAVHVVPYPNRVLSIWVYVASIS